MKGFMGKYFGEALFGYWENVVSRKRRKEEGGLG